MAELIGDVQVVVHVPTASRVGDHDIHALPSGEGLFVEYVTAASLHAFLECAAAAGARIPPVTRNNRGRGKLTWSAMVELSRPEEVDAAHRALPCPRAAD
eukprot:1773468-Pyramimonas_sp.AAC.1